MKTFKVTVTDMDGIVLDQYIVASYTEAEAEAGLFEGDKPEHDAIDEWVKVDGSQRLGDQHYLAQVVRRVSK
jgi:hypothetical protein